LQADSPSDDSEEHIRRRTAWNKGKSMPEAARLKLSEFQKKRWQDPQFRANVTEAMKGKVAWNKGRPPSEETKEKMRLAKLNRHHSRATRQKMSLAREGKTLSPAAAALVSSKLTGKPKSEEHKAAIAAAQRRRYAAVRALKAVEAVYESSSTDGSGGGGSGSGSMPRGVAAMKRERSQALNAFKGELREYRALQEELSPWTNAFQERHGRKPTTMDVQNTGIGWLISRFKQYILLRERIFNESTVLRSRIESGSSSGLGDGYSSDGNSAPSTSSLPTGNGPTNANGPTAEAKSAVASRVAIAMQYKIKKQAEEKQLQAADQNQNNKAAMDAAVAGMSSIEEEQQQPRAASFSADPAIATPKFASAAAAPPRVRQAMQAAMDYRKSKAAAVKAKAEAAAVSANAGWTERKKMVGPKESSAENAADGGVVATTTENENDSAASTITSHVLDTTTTSAVEEGPSCMVPPDIVRAQTAAHRAMREVKQAEAEVRRALRLPNPQADNDDPEQVSSVAGVGA